MPAGSRLRQWPTVPVVVIALTFGLRGAVDLTGHNLAILTAFGLALAPVALGITVLVLLAGPPPAQWRHHVRPTEPPPPFLRVAALRDRLDVGQRSAEQYRRAVHPLLSGLAQDRLARRGVGRAPAGPLRELVEGPVPAQPLAIAQVARIVAELEAL